MPKDLSCVSSKRKTEGVDILLKTCGRLIQNEKLLIICDSETRTVGHLILERAKIITPSTSLVEIPPLDMHGQEPPGNVGVMMGESDICLGITGKSMAHTKARRDASLGGTRYLSLPDYTIDLLADESLRVDFETQGILTKYVSDRFTRGSQIRVTSSAGTDIIMDIYDRVGNCCPGYVAGAGQLGSPPDIEANVSPIEDSSEGVIVVDGSIPYPGLGLLTKPLTLKVSHGSITNISGETRIVSSLERLFQSANSQKAYILAECGVGLNNKASLTGVMLTDEGTYGTMHFGFGSNYTVGGLNEVEFHLDFVFTSPTLMVDGSVLISDGNLKNLDTRNAI